MGTASTDSRQSDSKHESKENHEARPSPSRLAQKGSDSASEARKKNVSESPDLAKTIMDEVICSI